MAINSVNFSNFSLSRFPNFGLDFARPVRETREVDLRMLFRSSTSARRVLEKIRTELDVRGTRLRPAVVRSASDLGLDPAATATTLTSSGEVNATPTSFSPFGPAIVGSSTSEVTVDGIYTGAYGDDTLTFEFGRDGTVGSNDKPIKVEIRDGSGSKVGQFFIPKNSPVGTEYTLNNGLVVSFSDGTLKKNDTFSVDVSTSQGSAVDPDKPFDGVRDDYANFEYGTAVSAGSFEINGVQVDVDVSDSLNDVLGKINGAGAGVTATFNAGSETVRLARTTTGSAYAIDVGNDSSGFLAATKLAGATQDTGADGALEALIEDVPELAGISSGSLEINGASVNVDVANDRLTDVIQRINDSGAGVTATLDAAAQRLTVTSDDASKQIVIDDNGTGFFGTLEIAPGTYEPTGSRSGPSANRLSRLFGELVSSLNRLFADAEGSPGATRLVARVTDRIRNAFDSDGNRFRTDFGLKFDFNASAERTISYASGNASSLRHALGRGVDGVRDFFLGAGGDRAEALLPGLIRDLEAAEGRIRAEKSTGLLVDRLV